MGMPIQVVLTESERNREGMDIASTIAKLSASKARPEIRYQTRFPALSQDLYIPPGVDVHANRDASVPYFRLYISNLAFSLTADDLKQVFDPFGEIAFVDLHRDFVSRASESLSQLTASRDQAKAPPMSNSRTLQLHKPLWMP